MKTTRLYLYGFLLMVTVHPLHASEGKDSKSEPTKNEVTKNEPGKELHESNCIRCHDPQLYLRDARKMKSFDGLQNQVQTCVTNLGLTWFEDEVSAVSNYLNTQYYKFSKKK